MADTPIQAGRRIKRRVTQWVMVVLIVGFMGSLSWGKVHVGMFNGVQLDMEYLNGRSERGEQKVGDQITYKVMTRNRLSKKVVLLIQSFANSDGSMDCSFIPGEELASSPAYRFELEPGASGEYIHTSPLPDCPSPGHIKIQASNIEETQRISTYTSPRRFRIE